MLEKVRKAVFKLLEDENSGHGSDHIIRVYDLAMRFAETERADMRITGLAALLHDADDYKLFGQESAENLTNAKRIMREAEVDERTQSAVASIIKSMGYKKLLSGVRPDTLEGMVVSDADMCDAIGANGILRTYAYGLAHSRPFFDKDIWPIEDMDSERYSRASADSAVCHFFEKLLKLKDLMLTDSGRREAVARNEITIEFLRHIFAEENAPQWQEYLDKYLQRQNGSNA